MSGGMYDYAFEKINDVAYLFEEEIKNDHKKERKKLCKVLRLLSDICKNVEWIDSGDYGEECWEEIKKDLDKIKI